MSVSKLGIVLILSFGFAIAFLRPHRIKRNRKCNSPRAPPTPPAPTAAKPTDVASPEAILAD